MSDRRSGLRGSTALRSARRPHGRLALILLALAAALVVGPSAAEAASPPKIDQCRNGTFASPVVCTGSAWANGSANATQAHYREGDSIPYRVTFSGLTVGSTGNTITINYDTTAGGKHALDYLTTFNQTETTADPCSGVNTSSGGATCGSGLFAPTTFAIPVDPSVTAGQNGVDDAPPGATGGDDIAQFPGVFTFYGATITGLSAYTLTGSYAANSTTHITITFTANVDDPVLAWSGHIASRFNWGTGNSAAAINGSSYHTDIDGQDRSLSADAVVSPGRVFIIKDAVPDDPQQFTFTATGVGLTSPFTLVDNGDPSTATKVFSPIFDFTAKTVTESGPPAGWSLTGLSCTEVGADPQGATTTTTSLATRTVTMGLDEGEDVTCTFTNTRQAAQLTVIKHVINDSGGTKLAGEFLMQVTGTAVPSPPASFAGSEGGTTVTLNPGTYGVTESAVDGYTMSASADCSGSIAAGETKTCTVTNDDQRATLTVIKHVINDNGGTTPASAFDLTVSGGAPSPATFKGSEAGTTVAINAGAYSVDEAAVTGYLKTLGSGCSGNLAPGGSATCTITNDDQRATLTVIKHVINDNGGTTPASAFDLTVSGGAPSPATFKGSEAGTTVAINAGAYSVDEAAVTGYLKTLGSGCSGNLAPGGSATCTITNDDQRGTLIVVKHVVNDSGGAATAPQFTLQVTQDTDIIESFSGDEAGHAVTVDAGTYGVTESAGPGGYTPSFSDDCAGVFVGNGETKTCTVTNDDQRATLTVIKHVINDNGGTTPASAFDLTVSGGAPSPATFKGSEAGTTVAINAGAYSVDEAAVTGYLKTLGSGCSGNLAPGGSATCTITNDDQRATLTVIKHVINDNGGTTPASAFDLTVSGGAPSPATFKGSEAGTTVAINAGAYSVDEAAVTGYLKTLGSGCSGNLAPGGSATCTITNDDQRGTLIVVKHVVNDSGGAATAPQFTLQVTQDTDIIESFSGDEAGHAVTVDAGTYGVTESAGPGGYTPSFSDDCAGVFVGNGETKTCTVTNDDQRATLTVIKHVINDNGGTTPASAFDLTVSGGAPSPATFKGSEAGTTVAINAGAYSVDEAAVTGYLKTLGSGCSGNLAPGGSATCTITNDDQRATLTVIKHVINDNGGTTPASAFDLTVSGGAPSPATFKGSEAGTTVAINAGAYSVDEAAVTGYLKTLGSGCSGNLAPGGSATCTITNDDQRGTLIVVKHVVNDSGGAATAPQFTLQVTQDTDIIESFSGDEAGHAVTVDAGTYGVTESAGPGGYTPSFSDDCAGVFVGNGETKTCTVTNDDQRATLTVIKHVINDNGGTTPASAFDLTVSGGAPSPATFKGSEAGTTVAINAGAYSVDEAAVTGYLKTLGSGCSGNLAPGGSATCTITNDDQRATLTVIKHVINDNGGTTPASAFDLTVSGGAPSPATFKGSEAGTTVAINAGAYSVDEAAVTGYLKTLGSGCSGNLAPGGSATCTITNDDQRGTLIVVKHVVNDSGGAATAPQFTLQVTQDTDIIESFSGDEAGHAVTVDAGTYGVTESAGPGGYTPSFSDDCAGVFVGNGETKTCTVTNDDQRATLTVIKHVINDNGGTTPASAFDLTVSGGAPSPATFKGSEAGTTVAINAGAYSVDEAAISAVGYDKTLSGDCSGSISLGQSKTCTITNDDQPGTLKVIKSVINDNGGTKTAASFLINVTATNASPASFNGAAGPNGTTVTVNPGSYSVDEDPTSATGYAMSRSPDCIGTIAAGEEKTCTITNDDQAGTLTVIKHVDNSAGGTALASDFTMVVTGGSPSPASFPGSEQGTTVAINAGSYSVGESGPVGYIQSKSADCSGSIANGAQKICTITNTFTPQASQITPTQTTCAMFRGGTAATLSTVNYSLKGGIINQVDPGVFFYWIRVSAAAGPNSFTIAQDIVSSQATMKKFKFAAGSNAFDASCTAIKGTKITQNASGAVTVAFTTASAGTVFIGVKYDSGSVKGATAPSPTKVDYVFSTSGVPMSTSPLSLVKKK